MNDLLTTQEDAQAAADGWQLCHVFDLKTKRWLVEALPTPDAPFKRACDAQAVLIHNAKLRDAVALRALQLVMASRQGKK